MPIRIIADPNVWISARITRNDAAPPVTLYRAVMTADVIAVVSPKLLEELAGVLTRPKFRQWVSLEAAHAFVDGLSSVAELHPDPLNPAARCRDPHDDYLLALAETTGALLVTGDRDLLDLDEPKPSMVTPRELLDLLGDI